MALDISKAYKKTQLSWFKYFLPHRKGKVTAHQHKKIDCSRLQDVLEMIIDLTKNPTTVTDREKTGELIK